MSNDSQLYTLTILGILFILIAPVRLYDFSSSEYHYFWINESSEADSKDEILGKQAPLGKLLWLDMIEYYINYLQCETELSVQPQWSRIISQR